jgi:diguanylate cyclase (GGDEF)-like protein
MSPHRITDKLGMQSFVEALERQSQGRIALYCLIIVAIVGVADYLLGKEISSSILYVLPIGIAAWYGSRNLGVALAIAAAVTWLIVDELEGVRYSYPAILYWNALVRFGLYSIIVYLLTGFRKGLAAQILANIDPLTGALNARAFYERVEQEIQRARRYKHPFTMAFIDLDDFKLVNDTHGHAAGDDLLRTVVSVMKSCARETDVVVRMGGDEFVILLIETSSETSKDIVQQFRYRLLSRMSEAGYTVTASIGMVTYDVAPIGIRQMLKTTDELMYRIKRSGKNGVMHITVTDKDGRQDRGTENITAQRPAGPAARSHHGHEH